MHRKPVATENDTNSEATCRKKPEKNSKFSLRHNDDSLLQNWDRNKFITKGYSNNLPSKLIDKSNICIRKGKDCKKTLDLVLNFELGKKKPNYTNAYFTESDLKVRKRYNERSSIKNGPPIVTNVNVQVLEMSDNNDSSNDCLVSVVEKRKKKVRTERVRKELEDLFRVTDSDFNEYCRENDEFKYLDKYYKEPGHRKKKKHFYNHCELMGEKQPVNSPAVQCSKVNVLNQISKNVFKSKRHDLNDNLTKDSLNNTCLKRKFFHKSDKVKFIPARKKSKNTTAESRRSDSRLKNSFSNNSNTNSPYKDSSFCTNNQTPPKNGNLPSRLSANEYNVHLKDIFYNLDVKNFIYQKPEKLEHNKKIDTTTYPSNNIFLVKKSHNHDKILDCNLLNGKQNERDGITSKILANEIFYDNTVNDRNEKKSHIEKENHRNVRRPSCEIILNRMKNDKRIKSLDYEKFLKNTLSSKTNSNDSNHESFICSCDKFEEFFRNCLIDKNIREYNNRKKLLKSHIRAKSEYSPSNHNFTKNEKSASRPNSVERDTLRKDFEEIPNDRKKFYNYDPQFDFREISSTKSHKFSFDQEKYDIPDVLNLDDNVIQPRDSNHVSLKLSIPNMYLIKDIDDADTLSNLRVDENQSSESNSAKLSDNLCIKHELKNLMRTSNPSSNDTNYNADILQILSFNELKNVKEENNFESKSIVSKVFSQVDLCNVRINELENNFKTKKNDLLKRKEVPENKTSMSNELNFQHYSKKLRNCESSIETIFPINSKRKISHSHTTLATIPTSSSLESSKLRSCKSLLSQFTQENNLIENGVVETKETDVTKEITVVDEKNQSSKNIEKISDNNSKLAPIKNERLSELEDIDDKKNTVSKLCKQNSFNKYSLIGSYGSKFKLEVENMEKTYLMNNIFVNWMTTKKYDIILIPKDEKVIKNPEELIDMLQKETVHMLENRIKSGTIKFCKIDLGNGSLEKDEVTGRRDCASIAKNENKNHLVVPYKSDEKCKNYSQNGDLIIANTKHSVPTFNCSKSKMHKNSVTYYSFLNSHGIKINKHKRKNINKTVNSKTICNNNQKKSNKSSRNKIDDTTNHMLQESEIFEEVNKFQKLLAIVERKQNAILSLLNQDPCGMLCSFASYVNVKRPK